MRIERLQLAPYGAFRDLRLDFGHTGDGGGLHLVFGTNGAGKSTTLEALRSVLFGIERGKGNHRFESETLRLGATLSRTGGEALTFLRRTSTKSPLWDAEDRKALPAEALAPFLGGLDRGRFQTLFGLDLETMVEGGEELLSGGGEIGRALFGAGLGGKQLATVTKRLDADARTLWAPRSRKSRAHGLMARHRELVAERKRAEMRRKDYDTQRRELARLRKLDAEDDAQHHGDEQRRSKLSRLVNCLALLGPLTDKEQAIESFGEATPLPEQVITAANAALAELDALERDRVERERRLHDDETTRIEIAARVVPSLEAAAHEIEELAGRRAAYRSAFTERDALGTELAEATGARDEALRRCAVEPAPAPTLAASEDLMAAADRHHAELERAQSARRSALAEAERARKAAARAASLAAADDALSERFARELESLAPFRGRVEDLESVALPSSAAVESAAERDESHRRATEQHGEEIASCEREARAANAERAALGAHALGTPPTADDLRGARDARNAALSAALGRALRGDEVTAEAALDCERANAEADRIADAIMAQSARVAQRVANEQTLGHLADESKRLHQQEEALAAQRAALDEAWHALTRETPLAALAPKDAAIWIERRSALLERMADVRRGLARDAEAAQAELDAREAALAATETERGEADAAWRTWAATHQLDGDAGPEAARQRLRVLADARALGRDVVRAEEALRSCVKLVETFERDVAELVARCAAPAASEPGEHDEVVSPSEARLVSLVRALEASKRATAEQGPVVARIDKERSLARRGAERARELERTLDAMADRAGLESRAQFRARVAVSSELRTLRQDHDELASAFRTAAGERTPNEIRSELGDRTQETLEEEIATLTRAIEEREAERRARRERMGELRPLVEGEGSDRGAVLASEIAGVEAELAEVAADYARTRIAQALLEREVDRYRQQTQGPLLERAQALFETLTLGAYVKLHPSEARGKAVMVARRPDGRTVHTDGMSTGTRDQLYLALRIASVEHMLDTVEPMPFIADDLFVNFDDTRTEAALRVLAELSAATQVIVFSHHGSVVETATRLTDEGIAIDVVRLESERERELQKAE